MSVAEDIASVRAWFEKAEREASPELKAYALEAATTLLASVSMDAWFDYIRVLMGELRPEVNRLTESDAALKQNYGRFLGLWGREMAEILQRPRSDAP